MKGFLNRHLRLVGAMVVFAVVEVMTYVTLRLYHLPEALRTAVIFAVAFSLFTYTVNVQLDRLDNARIERKHRREKKEVKEVGTEDRSESRR